MATADFYRDERPAQQPDSEGKWESPPLVLIPTPEWEEITPPSLPGYIQNLPPWMPKIEDTTDTPWVVIGSWNDEGDGLIIVDGEGMAMTNGVELLMGPCCMKITIECQIKGGEDDKFNHYHCILLGAVSKEGEVKSNAVLAGLLKNGEIDIYARWQKGHYNHSYIHTVRFRLKDQEETQTPWYHIPIGETPGKRVMTLVVQDGIISTKSAG